MPGQSDWRSLTAGQVHDWSVPMNCCRQSSENRARDKAYDADARVIELCGGWQAGVIPPKKNRKEAAPTIGSCIRRAAWWKFLLQSQTVRAIATRYDKTARNFSPRFSRRGVIWLN